jgi:hypothetical protein
MNDEDKPAVILAPPPVVDVLVFRAGRWHLRDGNRFDKKPYYLELPSGRLVEPP